MTKAELETVSKAIRLLGDMLGDIKRRPGSWNDCWILWDADNVLRRIKMKGVRDEHV